MIYNDYAQVRAVDATFDCDDYARCCAGWRRAVDANICPQPALSYVPRSSRLRRAHAAELSSASAIKGAPPAAVADLIGGCMLLIALHQPRSGTKRRCAGYNHERYARQIFCLCA